MPVTCTRQACKRKAFVKKAAAKASVKKIKIPDTDPFEELATEMMFKFMEKFLKENLGTPKLQTAWKGKKKELHSVMAQIFEIHETYNSDESSDEVSDSDEDDSDDFDNESSNEDDSEDENDESSD